MLNIFKRIKRQREIRSSLENQINTNLTKWKQRLAEWLNRKTRDWSPVRWRIVLVCFCVVASAASLYLIIKSLAFSNKVETVHITRIKMPAYPTRPYELLSSSRIGLTEQEHQKLREIVQYMDSLSKTDSGRPIYDSIMKLHPGLLDSIRMLEQLYQLQNK